MKKKIGLFFTFMMALTVILVGCGSNKETSAKEDKNTTLLKPGTVWKDDDSTLKVIDDSTWEYTEDSPMPVSKQISVKRVDDYKDFETYEIVDSADVKEFINNQTHKLYAVPLKDDGMIRFSFGNVPSSDKVTDKTHDEIIEYSRKYVDDNYKLQK